MFGRVQRLRAERNQLSKQIGRLPAGERPAAIARAAAVKEELARLEPELREVEDRFQQVMLALPNPPDPACPAGDTGAGNA